MREPKTLDEIFDCLKSGEKAKIRLSDDTFEGYWTGVVVGINRIDLPEGNYVIKVKRLTIDDLLWLEPKVEKEQDSSPITHL